MNKEQQELVNEAYKNYRSKSKDIDLPENLYNKLIDDLNKDAMFPIDNPNRMLTKEEFINKCKTDQEFSEKWGLKIEERELSLEEREKIAITKYPQLNETPHGALIDSRPFSNEFGDSLNIPTKLITITYNDKTIESYES
jgi:sensor domain CHASE-containing protein